MLQVHLVVFNGSVGGKLRLTVLEALEDEADALAAHARLFVQRQRRDVASFQTVGAGIRVIEQAEPLEVTVSMRYDYFVRQH